jgi:excinuclease ABC subunit C
MLNQIYQINKLKVDNPNKGKLINKAKDLPEVTGIYLMKDKNNYVIYVGKSKNLKNRVTSYFYELKNRSSKIEKMIGNIEDFDYIVTDTELDALVLECNYIKKIKPRYNSMLKNHNKYPYIRIAIEEEYPYLELCFEKDDNKSMYFGPYVSKNYAQDILNYINFRFKIRKCKRYKNSPCLDYHLKRCIGPCTNNIDKDEYKNNIDETIHLLKGNIVNHINDLERKMMQCSIDLNFEEAQICKDYISTLKYLSVNQKVISETYKGRNILACEKIGNNVKIFLIKGNNIVYSEVIDKYKYNVSVLSTKLKYYTECYFNKDIENIVLNKEDIDEAIIIYSYLKSKNNNIEYVEIQKSLLHKNNENRLDTYICNFINNKILI